MSSSSEVEWNPYSRHCSSRELLDRIADRWTVLIVGVLSGGPARFSEISRQVEGISQKVLTQTLRSLERDGMVTRTVFAQVPPRVEYELTELGQSLHEPLRALERWAVANMGTVRESRHRYDSATT